MEQEALQYLFGVILLVFLICFFFTEACLAKYNPPIGHTTGIIVCLGILLSFIARQQAISDPDFSVVLEDLRFNDELFFYLLLPLIIFPSGYNMRRKKFFRNIGTIMKFGFLGTIICFAVYSGLTYGVLKAGLLKKSDPKTGEEVGINMTMFEVLGICSLLCSSDVIAAISMVSYKQQPKLFSIIYGEGVFNDIVSIILFNTVQGMRKNFDFDVKTAFGILGNFLALGVVSILIGLAAGLVSSLLFKHARSLTHSPITETLTLFILAGISYCASEAAEQSGIISLLTCGVTMAHYTWYNLSPQGKTISSVTYSLIGSAAEAVVFAYVGLCVFTYAEGDEGEQRDSAYTWSPSFIGWMTAIIICGRLLTVFSVHGLAQLCRRKGTDPDVNIRELTFIAYGGMIRGAIAFGLVLKIPTGKDEDGVPLFRERGVTVTTTLAVVIITTVLFGTFMPLIQRVLFPVSLEEANEPEIPIVSRDSQINTSEDHADVKMVIHSDQARDSGLSSPALIHSKYMSQVAQPIPEETHDEFKSDHQNT